jgi:nucleoside recognition membrane protein YjiH
MAPVRTVRRFLKFIVPSVAGTFFFLFPVRYEEIYTIPIAVLTGQLNDLLGVTLPYIAVGIVTISAVLTVYYSWFADQPRESGADIRSLFVVGHSWVMLRCLGCLTAVMILWQLGPEFVWGETTGQVVLFELVTAILTIFIFASFLLPLLTDFGLMELVGTALSKSFQRLFRLPGRSCIDALASWMAAAPVGVLITSQQFEKGNYSGREAATIATNFSVVSLPFCVVVAQFSGLGHLFIQYYLTVCIAGFVAAVILPRIPPLSRIPDIYSEAGRQLFEDDRGDEGLLKAGYRAALAKADTAPGLREYARTAIHNLFDIWFGLMPPLMIIGTVGLVVVEYTPVFVYLSWPIVPLLELMQIPDAVTAAPAMLAGFAEMFLPAVMTKGVESELTRFVVISVSITQLIYMTEVGVLILKTRIPLGFMDLVSIFLLRTLITLPIITAIAHGFVF